MKAIAIAASLVVVAAGGLAGILVGGASAELARDNQSIAHANPSAAIVVMTPRTHASTVLRARAQGTIRARAVPEQMFTASQSAPAAPPQTAAPLRNRAQITALTNPQDTGARNISPAPALRVAPHNPPAATPASTTSSGRTRANHRGRGTEQANTAATHSATLPATHPALAHQQPPAAQQATTSPAVTPLPAAGPAPDATRQTTMSFADAPPPSAPPPPVTAPQTGAIPTSEQPAPAVGNP